MMLKTIIHILENTETQKKCLGLTRIFFDQVCLKDHKIAHMKKFDVFFGDKFRFFTKLMKENELFKKKVTLSIYSADLLTN